MKATVSIAIFILIAFFAFGQNETLSSPGQISEVKVTPPEFTGSTVTNEKSLIKNYLAENVITPVSYDLIGTEVVQFTVTTEGKVTDFKIINSVSRAIDQEMIRILKTTNGMWKPGYNNNQPVDMTKEVSIRFYPEWQVKPADELFTKWALSYYNNGSKALFEKHNYKKALRCLSDAINLMPNDKSLLMLRGICRYELGDSEGALQDWNRITNLGETIDMSDYTALLQGMKGYDELMAVLKK